MDGVPTPPRHGGLGRRPLGTPSDSVERVQRSRAKRPSTITTVSELQLPPQNIEADTPRGYYCTKTRHLTSKRPVYDFLACHKRLQDEMGDTAYWNGKVTAWWNAEHGLFEQFDGSATSTSKYLAEIAQDEELSVYYGLTKMDGKPVEWKVSRFTLTERTDALKRFSLPEGWSEMSALDGSSKFRTEVSGMPVVVTMAKPGPSGATSVKNICLHRHDVTAHDVLGSIPVNIRTAAELNSVLLQVANLQPCTGIRVSQYPDAELRQGYGSVVRQALRNGRPPEETTGMGHFPGFVEGSVSSTLYVVGDEHVFWHTECEVFAKAGSSPVRCTRCETHNTRTLSKKVEEAASQEFNIHTANALLSTAQKEKKLAWYAKQYRGVCDEKRRREIKECQEDDIVVGADELQGRRLHEALQHED